ncbi:type II secretion system protein [Clostridium thailandense]|uniref:type II secretion system protein n=1 Tax=Clostridium thailandense TaxID=2794346 RepID=UPI003989B014
MNLLKKKKGFTLIELMIVLAIIAILAVVLIPKSSIFKKNANTAGVTTNMNTVRGYLETKTGDNFIDTPSNLATQMTSNFSGEDAIANPADKTIKTISASTVTSSTKISVYITSAIPDNTDNLSAAQLGYIKGSVIIYIHDNEYDIYGVDLDGVLLKNISIVKQ